jgi:prepilin-type N-terminal cleavage/methylation domain-containing protein/prepilin-type processing-associated H-X9-DG protein
MRRCVHISSRRDRWGFTLVELLVVVAVIALLISLLLPALASARRAARATKCLVQIRSLAIAHTMHMGERRERFIDAGLGHGGVGEPATSWPVQLQAYLDAPIGLRSPADDSPFWSTSEPSGPGTAPGATLGQYLELARTNQPAASALDLARWTSYGLNNYLTASKAPVPELTGGKRYDALPRVPRPSSTVHFLMMTLGHRGGTWAQFAKSDHVHAEAWGDNGPDLAPMLAAREMALNIHAGAFGSARGQANYAYLDGHATTSAFAEVYSSTDRNAFDPGVAP